MQAKILKYKHNRTAKKALFIRNGTPRDAIGIQLNKNFTMEDAERVIAQIQKGWS
jgi:hypothetical protein